MFAPINDTISNIGFIPRKQVYKSTPENMDYYHYYPMIELLRLMEQLRRNTRQNKFTQEQTTMYYKTLTYIINQLEFPFWAERFKANGLDRYFFQTIGIVISPNKEIVLNNLQIEQANALPSIVGLKLRGLETLINETLNSFSKKQIQELNTLLNAVINASQRLV